MLICVIDLIVFISLYVCSVFIGLCCLFIACLFLTYVSLLVLCLFVFDFICVRLCVDDFILFYFYFALL